MGRPSIESGRQSESFTSTCEEVLGLKTIPQEMDLSQGPQEDQGENRKKGRYQQQS